MKVLVFGKTGQVATELAAFDEVICLGRDQADLTDPGACEAVIAATDAQAVVNAAAYTAVDRAEEEGDTAMIVNAMAPTAQRRRRFLTSNARTGGRVWRRFSET
jgi:dTDP-4-dehydrorhamnose reductase